MQACDEILLRLRERDARATQQREARDRILQRQPDLTDCRLKVGAETRRQVGSNLDRALERLTAYLIEREQQRLRFLRQVIRYGRGSLQLRGQTFDRRQRQPDRLAGVLERCSELRLRFLCFVDVADQRRESGAGCDASDCGLDAEYVLPEARQCGAGLILRA